MLAIILFLLGLCLGSFLHVLASRYEEERFLLGRHAIGGRSHCPHCGRTLSWHELIPLLSFLMQRGRCRACGARIGWSYFIVELASGLIVATVPLHALATLYSAHPFAVAGLWTAAMLILLCMTLIDMRLYLIPDELTVGLALCGLAIAWLSAALVPHLWAGLGAAAFFGLLVAATRGKGMGLGDVKLAFALGLLFGWPSIVLAVMLAFVIGAAVGLALIARGAKKMQSAVPFVPFLAIASLIVFFYGQAIFMAWLRLAGGG